MNETAQKPRWQPAPPLKPRPVLFAVLSLVTTVWVAGLLVMYFTTVRDVGPRTAPASQASPTLRP